MINKIIFIATFILVSSLSFSQDIIVKKIGSTIEAKIIEITPSVIKYKKFSQLDGPLRNIEIINVKEIRYEDGEVESFEGQVEEIEEEVIREPAPKVELILFEPKDHLLTSGFFFNALLGYGGNTRYDEYYYDPYYYPINNVGYQEYTTHNITMNLVIGNKWYFGSSEKWRPGLQVNWGRIGINLDPDNPESIIIGAKNISPVNVGMCNIFKFSEKTGLELNFTTGFNLEVNPDYGRTTPGLAISPEVKFRYNMLAIGIDYSRIQTFGNDFELSNWNIVGLTVGIKL